METRIENIVKEPKIHCIFTPSTRTWCYVVADEVSGHSVIIDAVLSRDPSSAISTACPDAALALVHAHNYTITYALETNAHEQHTSAAFYLRTQVLENSGRAPRISVRQSLQNVQRLYARKYGVRNKFWAGEFDGKFVDGEVLRAGNLRVRVVYLPGLSKDHVGYVVGSHIFMGDCCFHTPDGSDLSGIVKARLAVSLKRLQNMPKDLRISTTRGCPARLKGPGCVMEIREHHETEYAIPRTGVAGWLDEGSIP